MRAHSESEANARTYAWLDVLLVLVLMSLLVAFLLAAPSPEREWSASTGNALLGLNAIAWGCAFALAYRFPHASLILRILTKVGRRMDRLGPLKVGRLGTLMWAVFLLLTGLLMFVTGAGWA